MKSWFCAAVLFTAINLSNVYALSQTPPAWKAFCMLVQTGRPPQKETLIKFGDKIEIFRQGIYSYQVEYGNFGNPTPELMLSALNTTTNLRSYAMVSADTLPKSITLVHETGKVVFTCMTQN